MTPRKWTAADVAEEDRLRFLEAIDVSFPELGDITIPATAVSELVAACWNRLEEKRAKERPLDAIFALAPEDPPLQEVLEACDKARADLLQERRKDVLLRQALETLRTAASYPIARSYPDGRCFERVDMEDFKEAIAALEKEVGA